MELLRHRRAADHVPTLEHRHLQPRPGQVEGADQAVVPPADQDHIDLAHYRGVPTSTWRPPQLPSSPAVSAGNPRTREIEWLRGRAAMAGRGFMGGRGWRPAMTGGSGAAVTPRPSGPRALGAR